MVYCSSSASLFHLFLWVCPLASSRCRRVDTRQTASGRQHVNPQTSPRSPQLRVPVADSQGTGIMPGGGTPGISSSTAGSSTTIGSESPAESESATELDLDFKLDSDSYRCTTSSTAGPEIAIGSLTNTGTPVTVHSLPTSEFVDAADLPVSRTVSVKFGIRMAVPSVEVNAPTSVAGVSARALQFGVTAADDKWGYVPLMITVCFTGKFAALGLG